LLGGGRKPPSPPAKKGKKKANGFLRRGGKRYCVTGAENEFRVEKKSPFLETGEVWGILGTSL